MSKIKLSVKFSLALFCILSALLFSCAGSPQNRGPVIGGNQRASQPDWVRDPYTLYDRQENIAFVGSGNTRQDAERNALRNLVAFFGQDIQVDETIRNSFQQAVRGGIIANWSEDTEIDTEMQLKTGMDNLVGAEIGEAWIDSRGNHYVAAVLNKPLAARIYASMVMANLETINNLTNLTGADINSFDGYGRFLLAADIADVTVTYGNLLQQIGFPFPGIENGTRLRIEAGNIKNKIPVMITLTKNADVDRAGRIESAFARALSELGFQSGGTGSRYVLDVNISLTPVAITGNPFLFSRIEVSANLVNAQNRTVLLPFNFNLREGHSSQGEADNRAITAAAALINNEYADILNDFLTRRLPGI